VETQRPAAEDVTRVPARQGPTRRLARLPPTPRRTDVPFGRGLTGDSDSSLDAKEVGPPWCAQGQEVAWSGEVPALDCERLGGKNTWRDFEDSAQGRLLGTTSMEEREAADAGCAQGLDRLSVVPQDDAVHSEVSAVPDLETVTLASAADQAEKEAAFNRGASPDRVQKGAARQAERTEQVVVVAEEAERRDVVWIDSRGVHAQPWAPEDEQAEAPGPARAAARDVVSQGPARQAGRALRPRSLARWAVERDELVRRQAEGHWPGQHRLLPAQARGLESQASVRNAAEHKAEVWRGRQSEESGAQHNEAGPPGPHSPDGPESDGDAGSSCAGSRGSSPAASMGFAGSSLAGSDKCGGGSSRNQNAVEFSKERERRQYSPGGPQSDVDGHSYHGDKGCSRGGSHAGSIGHVSDIHDTSKCGSNSRNREAADFVEAELGSAADCSSSCGSAGVDDLLDGLGMR